MYLISFSFLGFEMASPKETVLLHKFTCGLRRGKYGSNLKDPFIQIQIQIQTRERDGRRTRLHVVCLTAFGFWSHQLGHYGSLCDIRVIYRTLTMDDGGWTMDHDHGNP